VQMMETSSRVLRKEHPNTLTNMNNLAFTLKGQVRSDEAVSVLELCLQLAKHVFGPQHSNILSSLQVLSKWQKEILEPCRVM